MKQTYFERNISILTLIISAGLMIVFNLGFCRVAQACSVPVFRYALERWPADAYRLVVFHNGSLSSTEEKLRERIESSFEMEYGRSTMISYWEDVNDSVPESLKEIWDEIQDKSQPCMVLLPPISSGGEIALWTAPLSDQSIDQLIESPARRELANRLISGETAVWLLLESGDTQKDEAATKVLSEGLQEMEANLKLPHELDPFDTEYDTDLSEGIELKLDFSILPVDLNDPCEILLASVFKDMVVVDGNSILPAVVPVFGRARALVFLEAVDVDTDSIADICHFLVGPCSCQVKQMNPGMDLPLLVDWDAKIVGMMGDEEIPTELLVPGATLETDTNEVETQSVDMNGLDVKPESPNDLGMMQVKDQNIAKVPAETPDRMQRHLVWLALLVFVIIGIGSVVIMKRK